MPAQDDVVECIFRKEPVIGHHIRAEVLEKSELGKQIDRAAKEHGVPPRRRPKRVRITQGDVDWDSSYSVVLNTETILELAEAVENMNNTHE